VLGGLGLVRAVDSVYPDSPGIRPGQARQQVDRGRLPGPVGAEEAEELAPPYGESEAVDRLNIFKPLVQVPNLDGRGIIAIYALPPPGCVN